MAAEMVTSAVAQEAVNQVLSRLKERCEQKSVAKEHMERMEMAHIKLEAALEMSNRWNITTSAPLLRWRSKLKRASQECDHTLRRCKQRLEEEEEMQNSVRSSFPKKIADAARSFVKSIFTHDGEDELRGSAAVRRFERFADGASEFLRYVELGGTPGRYMFFDPLITHLLAGKGTKYCSVRGSQHLSFLLQPFSSTDRGGMEGSLVLLLKDSNASEKNFVLSLNLRLCESVDIVRVAVSCLHLFMPHLGSTVEAVKTKLTQVPTQDLCWVSSVCERTNSLYSTCSKWIQPNPLCCQQQDHYYAQGYNATSLSSESLLCKIYLEPVLNVYLLAHVSPPVGDNKQRAAIDGETKTRCTRDFPYLKLGMYFWPHASSEDFLTRVEGSSTEMSNNGEAMLHDSLFENISFEQLGKMMLPKAVDFLYGNVAATSYQKLWKSKHGGAYLRAERIDVGRKRTKQRQVKKVEEWASANNEFMNSWIAHAPASFRGSAMDWFQKEKRLPQPLLFKTNSCVHDCPIMLLSLQYFRSLASKIKSVSMFNA